MVSEVYCQPWRGIIEIRGWIIWLQNRWNLSIRQDCMQDRHRILSCWQKNMSPRSRYARKAESPVNAKSVVRLLAEGIGQGTKAELAAEGPDEAEAIEALAALVASGFGE